MWFGPLLLCLSLPLTDRKGREYDQAEAMPPWPQKLAGSIDPSVSADGRFVAFTSGDVSLLASDTNGAEDVLVWDRQTGRTELASVSTSGSQGNGDSRDAVISADGRFVAYESSASNLVEGDTNGADDIFVRDRKERITERISVSSTDEGGDNWCSSPAISGDGRFIAFCSQATNLVPRDTNREPDIFVRDRAMGTTERVSVGVLGAQAGGASTEPAISADGQFVAFHSWADNLVAGDDDVTPNVFLRDRKAGSTIRANLLALPKRSSQEPYGFRMSADGRFLAVMPVTLVNWDLPIPRDVDESVHLLVWDRKTNTSHRICPSDARKRGNLHSSCLPAVSADGRYIAFDSRAANMVPDDTNGAADVFMVERDTGAIQRISVTSTGTQGHGTSMYPSVSADGRFVAFTSYATNLVAGDTNEKPDVFLRDTKMRTTIQVSNAAVVKH